MRHAHVTTIASLTITMTLALAIVSVSGGCKSSHEEGVKTSYRSQWTTVNANTEATTAAAKDVLQAEGLKEVKATSTAVDGTASGKKADGTKVNVSIEKQEENRSQVSVNVGMMGDPELGAEIAKKIKDQAEGR